MALEDAHAGSGEGLDCGTQPDGTLNETDRERGQGGGAGRNGFDGWLTSRKWTLLRHEGGVLDQPVEYQDRSFGSPLIHDDEYVGSDLQEGGTQSGVDRGQGGGNLRTNLHSRQPDEVLGQPFSRLTSSSGPTRQEHTP